MDRSIEIAFPLLRFENAVNPTVAADENIELLGVWRHCWKLLQCNWDTVNT